MHQKRPKKRAGEAGGSARFLGSQPRLSTKVDEIGGLLSLASVDSAGAITLFPTYGAAETGERLIATFDGNQCGSTGAFEVGLHRG